MERAKKSNLSRSQHQGKGQLLPSSSSRTSLISMGHPQLHSSPSLSLCAHSTSRGPCPTGASLLPADPPPKCCCHRTLNDVALATPNSRAFLLPWSRWPQDDVEQRRQGGRVARREKHRRFGSACRPSLGGWEPDAQAGRVPIAPCSAASMAAARCESRSGALFALPKHRKAAVAVPALLDGQCSPPHAIKTVESASAADLAHE